MRKELRGLPRAKELEENVRRLIEEKRDEIVSVVLFGSMAKDTWTTASNYDLLIVSRRNGRRFFDMALDYYDYFTVPVDLFVYTVEEVNSMFEDLNTLILDALKDGVVLFDEGYWKELHGGFAKLLESGTTEPRPRGWTVKKGRQG